MDDILCHYCGTPTDTHSARHHHDVSGDPVCGACEISEGYLGDDPTNTIESVREDGDGFWWVRTVSRELCGPYSSEDEARADFA